MLKQQLSLFDQDISEVSTLSQYEEKLIIDNQKIIYKVLRDLNITNTEDFFDLGLIALVNAVKSYDVTKKGGLSHHLYIQIKYMVMDEIKKQNKDSYAFSNSITDLEEFSSTEEYDSDNSFNASGLSILADDYNLEEEFMEKEEYNFKKSTLIKLLNNNDYFTNDDRFIFCSFYGFGLPLLAPEDIAAKYNFKRQTINARVSIIVKKLKELVSHLEVSEVEK